MLWRMMRTKISRFVSFTGFINRGPTCELHVANISNRMDRQSAENQRCFS